MLFRSDGGGGTPIVVIPGIQGRWEWMKPAIDTLAQRSRVITFSLADEPTCGGDLDDSRGIDSYVEQVRAALDLAGIERAAVCGVSFGGLIAAAFAARFPDRVSSLVLVSALPPTWTPDSRVRFYLRAPRLLSPLFCVGSVRLCREIFAANPGLSAGIGAAARHGWRVVTHLFSPGRMARRVRLLDGLRLQAELATMVWSHPSIRHSWYRNESGRIFILSPWRLVDFWSWTRVPDADAFTLR